LSSSSLVAIRHPILVWGSPFWFGDPQTKTGIPKPKWGCESQESPNRFGDPRTEMGIKTSPYQNGDPRIGLGIVQSLTHTNMGFIPIWGPTELIPKLERHSKWGPHIGMGIPISVWVGICQYSKSGSPHTNMGFIPIWGPTYTSMCLCAHTRTCRWFFTSTLNKITHKIDQKHRTPSEKKKIRNVKSVPTYTFFTSTLKEITALEPTDASRKRM
jgi:hypothetical protein